MAREGKFTKLMKKLSLGKFPRSSSDSVAASTSLRSDISLSSSSSSVDDTNKHLHPVYVGGSRRQYLLTSDIVANPLFQQLAGKSSDSDAGAGDEITVGCEVVLFEHLLWILEDVDSQPESLNELVDFYAC